MICSTMLEYSEICNQIEVVGIYLKEQERPKYGLRELVPLPRP
jgi:hypothetical protein